MSTPLGFELYVCAESKLPDYFDTEACELLHQRIHTPTAEFHDSENNVTETEQWFYDLDVTSKNGWFMWAVSEMQRCVKSSALNFLTGYFCTHRLIYALDEGEDEPYYDNFFVLSPDECDAALKTIEEIFQYSLMHPEMLECMTDFNNPEEIKKIVAEAMPWKINRDIDGEGADYFYPVLKTIESMIMKARADNLLIVFHTNSYYDECVEKAELVPGGIEMTLDRTP